MNYGNWIRLRIVVIITTIGIVTLLISLLPLNIFVRSLIILVAALIFATALFIIYVYSQFSTQGGNLQGRLWSFLLDHLHWGGVGSALDIGTGNGPLAITLAKRYPEAQVTGIDYWGSDWEYSQSVCERNAVVEGVAERVIFLKGNAANLAFEDGQFDAVVSHFVFHEVADARDKREVVREALRVLHKGGAFAFQDMFYDSRLYGDIDGLLATIKSWGIDEVHLVNVQEALAVPRLLRHPRVLGMAALIYGTK